MTRKMLIIANPGEIGAENYCEGVNQDVTQYKRFFLSNAGGAWEPEEIEVLVCPYAFQVDTALEKLTSADYSMVVF